MTDMLSSHWPCCPLWSKLEHLLHFGQWPPKVPERHFWFSMGLWPQPLQARMQTLNISNYIQVLRSSLYHAIRTHGYLPRKPTGPEICVYEGETIFQGGVFLYHSSSKDLRVVCMDPPLLLSSQ